MPRACVGLRIPAPLEMTIPTCSGWSAPDFSPFLKSVRHSDPGTDTTMNGNFRPPSRRGSADAGGSASSLPNTSILRVLTNTQNASAAVFGVFFTAHLAAPVAAAFGGLAAADNVMVCLYSF